MITQKELQELFTYCEKTGNLLQKVKTSQRKNVGDIAGYNCNGYRITSIEGKNYKVHRLIWVMVHGSIDSKLKIDHINGIKDDNTLVNLRLVAQQENNKNKAKDKRNTSGITGVHWCKRDSKWNPRITVDGKQKNLGRFTNKDEAIKVRRAAEIKYGFHENHGRD